MIIKILGIQPQTNIIGSYNKRLCDVFYCWVYMALRFVYKLRPLMNELKYFL